MSEIARIRQQIEDEAVALALAMQGVSSVAKHQTIQYRYANIGACWDELTPLVGATPAYEIVVTSIDQAIDDAKKETPKC